MGIQGERVETGTDRMWLDSEFGRRVEFRLEELFARVAELLQRDRIWVLALAHALEAHKTVPGEDITAIIEGHQGPTIDGRVYHSPAFQAELEEYHADALRAHKESDRVAIPLPVPPAPELVHLAAAVRFETTYSNGDHEPPLLGSEPRPSPVDDDAPPRDLLRAHPDPSVEQPGSGNAASDPN
jgi:hypothetical protein